MKWDEITLDKIAEFKNGINYDESNFGKGLKVIGVSDFKDYRVPKYDGLSEINPDGIVNANVLLKENDILFVRSNGNKALVGRSVFLENLTEEITFSGFCIRCRFHSQDIYPKFYSYVFKGGIIRDNLSNSSGGTNINNLNQTLLGKLRVPLPSLPIQQKIASILSAYDDLIENNLKRIRLLEEAAQHLYQEWFVRFRFPCWEEAEFGADGLPMGWERKAIGEVCETVGGGTPSTKEPTFWDGGEIIWFSPTDLSKNSSLVLLDSASKITEQGLKNSSAKMLPPRTILMSSRATIGLFGIISKPCSTNQGFISIIPNEEHFRYYFLFNLINRKQEIINNANGSTFKEISKKHFREMEIVLPTSDLIKQFYHLSESFLNQVEYLERQNQKLKEARDILLPRLMDGRVEM